MLDRHAPVFVTGHRGLVGSAVKRRLTAEGFTNLLTASRQELDLRDQSAVDAWFAEHQPQYVFLVAGTVGGIGANSSRPADFLYDNLMIHGTVVHASYQNKVDKLLYLGSSCIYPRLAEQPIAEGALLSGPLEPTNEGYALAKIAGIKLCESYRRQYDCDFISAMPTNLYGPGDNFDLEGGHVLPALIRRFHEAKEAGVNEVQIWGTGSACREFLHVDDLADACLFLMDNYSEAGHVNVGTGIDDSIAALARQVRDLVHPEAEITYDTTKPDGTPRKVLEVSKLTELGWTAKTELADGLANTYAWFLQALAEGTARL
ncbi:MAG: GDP-L-fucose synthase [Actinobacteria bacterium]|jgi:GDP-L-fucose synthase|nr:GDP-L-fucose synthase [Actinomycetota bacterium]MBT3746816.1 GDP-L-fucose synthase [Actinomycetota bacterium]MBT3970053.1 GDP-L-fucose synthase [Actinomycetota bacterium]MBT4009439.1 GDP-L-fucose synthase [Actinomycetota bacterium]MBT4303547.1 GDP-L-fucose synthase [Actinomycetota bacterium]